MSKKFNQSIDKILPILAISILIVLVLLIEIQKQPILDRTKACADLKRIIESNRGENN